MSEIPFDQYVEMTIIILKRDLKRAGKHLPAKEIREMAMRICKDVPNGVKRVTDPAMIAKLDQALVDKIERGDTDDIEINIPKRGQ